MPAQSESAPSISDPDTRRLNITLNPNGDWDADDWTADSGYLVNTWATSELALGLRSLVWAEDGADVVLITEADAVH